MIKFNCRWHGTVFFASAQKTEGTAFWGRTFGFMGKGFVKKTPEFWWKTPLFVWGIVSQENN
jgi:hypothetical protein